VAAGTAKVEYAGSMAEAVECLLREVRSGDVVLTLGAGSVSHAAGLILEGLRAGG
jgi:UDP-N-acetylmuramate--alanine ligase